MPDKTSIADARWIPWVLLVLTCVAYVPAMRAGFIWDDDAYVTNNLLLRSFEGLKQIWTTTGTPQYYPLVFTSFWIEYQVWELDPFGYHLVNILLHGVNGLLVGLVLRRLEIRGAWWIAALFLVHPVHVESVAWVTERKNVLSGLFYLLALRQYLKFDEDQRPRDYGIALVLFVCALLSKTVTASLPVVIGLIVLYRRRRLVFADAARLVPFFGIAAALSAITVMLESGMVQVVSYDFTLSWVQRIWIACRGLLFYAQKLLVPHPLIFNYPRWDVEGLSVSGWWPVLVVILVATACLWLWRRGERGVVLGLAFFAVTLAPALGFINVYPFRYSFVADHFQYLASIGILILVVQGVLRLIGGRMAHGLGVAAVLLLATLTWNQSRAYRDLETLWQDTLSRNPSSWIAHNNLGLLQLLGGKLGEARVSFDEALRSNPRSAESYTGRGMVYMRMRQPDQALADLNRALELDPDYPQAYINRGQLFAALGQHQRVIEDFTRALAYKKDLLPAYKARGMAHLALGQYDSAIENFTEAIRFGANFEAYNDRGAAYLQAGRLEAALRDFDQAVAMNPNAAHALHNRGIVKTRLERYEDAVADFTRTLELDPDARKTYRVRGGLLFQVFGDRARGCADWQQACRLGDCVDYQASCTTQP